ncbi:MAG: HlyC/CorC family transporter [Deltaproteobacteria bacterium]|nr:HlyC/CorC family transporter [Deltaproteobacteria bacterium]
MTVLIISVGLAIFLSAGCSLFEAVLYSVPARHIEALVQDGKSGGRVFKEMREDVGRPVAAILSLNTVANTVGAAFAGSAATAVFGYQWLAYFSVLFTLAILIFSEIIPKTAGLVYGRILVPWVAYPLKWLVWIMTPAVWLSSVITGLISRKGHEDSISSEELRIMANMSLRGGGIKFYQKRAIESILTLQNKVVKEVMTPRTVVFSLSEHLTLEEAKSITTKWEHSRFPVYDDDSEDIVGIVLTKELFISLAEGKKDMHLTELMRPVHFVVETARLNAVLMEFLELRQHLFIVVDEYGGLSGVVSLEDILEEILGREIIDESDGVADKRDLARKRRRMLAQEHGKPGSP